MIISSTTLTVFDICDAVNSVYRVKPSQDRCAWCSKPLGPEWPGWVTAQLDAMVAINPQYNPPVMDRTYWRPPSAGSGCGVPIHIKCMDSAETLHNDLLPADAPRDWGRHGGVL